MSAADPAVTASAPAAPAHEADPVWDAYRRWGYLEADLDSLGRLLPAEQPELERAGQSAAAARRVYCGTIGAEFMHIPDRRRREWVAARMEAPAETPDRPRILDLLMRGEIFEQVLQQRYLGNKRFSIEGVETLLPLLTAILDRAAELGAEQAVLAMSHRGRLAVMTHIVGKSPAEVFAGFEDVDPRSILGGGDVKYHLGATGEYVARGGRRINVHLNSNPSHLEAVDPVAMGRTRAKQDRLAAGGAAGAERQVLCVTMHGDAAFAGQGILSETLNLAAVPGYGVGGTVHVIVNNLIGFTTDWDVLHSSRFAADAAKRLPIPVFHVNGEDPDAVARVGRLALEYRYEFGDDVVIDLIGFRRHGHSEVDDPTVTQPILYQKIKRRPPMWRLYAERTGADLRALESAAKTIQEELSAAQRQAGEFEKIPLLRRLPDYWDAFRGGKYDPSFEVDTGLPAERLRELGEGLVRHPDDFHVHPKVKKLLEERLKMAHGERPLDYGMAEALAFASLVTAGIPVRLAGQDTRRGTFNHRHSVLIDVENEREWAPLQHLGEGQAVFQSYDTILSEAAVVGFEYGYGRDYPEALVVWEAQFGDFANGAEVIIDQFIAAGEDKWLLLSGLVMLLPHGYEGQGPEHSSARIERYLQLAAEDNIQVAQPSNAAQYFHLLRRQALRPWRKPLVVFTPKSMLRHADAASPLADLSRPRFLPVGPDPELPRPEDARRILLCTGKIGHELQAERRKRRETAAAIVFLDQLYPFPEAELAAELDRHSNARDLVWVQEEPANMGALFYVQPILEHLAHGRHVRSVKRAASASPSTGSPKAHALEQKTLLSLAFT